MNKRKFKKTISIFVLVFLVLTATVTILSGCNQKISRTFFAADTVCTITLYDGNNEILDNAVTLCNDLANKFDSYNENSELSKLNKQGELENPDKDLYELIKKGLYYSQLKNGKFDITIKPVSELWDFKNEVIPPNDAIQKALNKVGYDRVVLNKKSIKLNNTIIELGAIAKGYIADKIIYFLQENGVNSAIVNLGGNISVLGKKKNQDFIVGIAKPFEQTTIASVKVSDMSVVTSGIYQRYIKKGDEIYHHLLNTKTGYPENNEFSSVTIIAKNSVDADALSTLCFLLGKEQATKLIEEKEGIEAVFIDNKNELFLTSGLKLDKEKVIIKK